MRKPGNLQQAVADLKHVKSCQPNFAFVARCLDTSYYNLHTYH